MEAYDEHQRAGDPPHPHHTTIGEAGACPECRAWNIDVVLKDAPYAFLLRFPPTDGDPLAVSLVRDWSPDGSDACDAAWATGCNLPRGVMFAEIPLGVALESGVEMFRIHDGDEATQVLRVINRMLAGPAADD